jgi:hypothetical protein
MCGGRSRSGSEETPPRSGEGEGLLRAGPTAAASMHPIGGRHGRGGWHGHGGDGRGRDRRANDVIRRSGAARDRLATAGRTALATVEEFATAAAVTATATALGQNGDEQAEDTQSTQTHGSSFFRTDGARRSPSHILAKGNSSRLDHRSFLPLSHDESMPPAQPGATRSRKKSREPRSEGRKPPGRAKTAVVADAVLIGRPAESWPRRAGAGPAPRQGRAARRRRLAGNRGPRRAGSRAVSGSRSSRNLCSTTTKPRPGQGPGYASSWVSPLVPSSPAKGQAASSTVGSRDPEPQFFSPPARRLSPPPALACPVCGSSIGQTGCNDSREEMVGRGCIVADPTSQLDNRPEANYSCMAHLQCLGLVSGGERRNAPRRRSRADARPGGEGVPSRGLSE